MTEATSPDVLGSLGINGKLFLAQLVNVSIILLVMWRWVYKPLLATIDARDKKIRDGLVNADEAKILHAHAEEEKEKIVREAKREAHELLMQAKHDAEEERARLHAETQAQIMKQLELAKGQLAQEKEAMIASIRTETATLVVRALEKVTAGAVDATLQKPLVKQSLDELTSSYGG